MTRRLSLVALCSACLLLSSLQPADDNAVVVPGDSKSMATRLDEARKLLAKQNTGQAVKLLQSILETATNDLVDTGDGRSVRARWLANAALARINTAGLKSYREGTESSAKKQFDLAKPRRDVAALRRIVDEAFCTKTALEALDLLGDLAFERGRLDEAREWWSLIARLDGGRMKDDPVDLLIYPDATDAQAARARAKQLLAGLTQGESGWDKALERFRKMHPKATGRLAGKEGNYADRLQALARERATRKPVLDDSWPTFGGNASRGRVAVAPSRLLDNLSQLCRPGPTWRFDLQEHKLLTRPLTARNRAGAVTRAQEMAFHPVVSNHTALIADTQSVVGYDLKTGKVSEWYDAAKYVGGIKPARWRLPAEPDLRYTLTLGDGAVFVRLGAQDIRDIRPQEKPGGGVARQRDNSESLLVCLNLQPGRDGDRRRWMVRAIDVGRKEYAVFEGAPMYAAGRVYIAATRFEGDKLITAIHCYPSDPEDSSPAPLWRADIAETRELLPEGSGEADRSKRVRVRHHLLTLAGSKVVYCSHSGAIVALDALTGKRSWAVRYPRRDLAEPEDAPMLRDLAPCVFADGKVYAAPADSDTLFCLDASTGRTLWKRDHLDVVHLLGVGQGRLIFTTYRNPQEGQLNAGGLRAVGADKGDDASGWSLPDDGGGLVPLGRGLLIGDLVLWPTARKPYGVFAVRQKDGLQPDNPSLLHRIPAGNLVYAGGCLLVAGERTLEAFVPPELLPDEDDQEVKADPDSLLLGMRRARALAARGKGNQALKAYQRVGKAIDVDSPGSVGRRLLGEIRREQATLTVALAKQIKPPRDLDTLVSTAMKDQPPRGKLQLAIERALLLEKHHPLEAAKAWQELRVSKAYLHQPIEDERGIPMSVASLAAARLLRLDGKKEPRSEKNPAKVSEHKPWSFAWPLARRWQIDLAPGEVLLPLIQGEGATQSAWTARPGKDGGELISRDEKGEKKWICTLPFVPGQVAGVGDLTIACGPGGIAGVARKDGSLEWVFPAPVVGSEPGSRGEGIRVVRGLTATPPLQAVGLAQGRLVCLQGETCLLAVDLTTGKLSWQWWAPGAAFDMPYPRGRILRVHPVQKGNWLVQASGRWWLLDGLKGIVLGRHATGMEPWASPPVRVDEKRILLVPDRDRVEMVDSIEGKSLWSVAMPGKTLRSREPPLVLGSGKVWRIILPLNVGYQWHDLDINTHKLSPLNWPLLQLDRLRPEDWHVANGTIYHASSEKLTGRSSSTGKILWQRDLAGAGSWNLHIGKDLLHVWPRTMTAGRFQFRWLGAAVQWQTEAWADAVGGTSLLTLDRATGEAIQRLNLPLKSMGAWNKRSSSPFSLLPLPTLWIDLRGAKGPIVQDTGKGLVIGQGGRLWWLEGSR